MTKYKFENRAVDKVTILTREQLIDLVLNHFGDGGMSTQGTAKAMMIMSEIDSAKGEYQLTKNCFITLVEENT